jgi:class 3 adenylate cyclase
MKLFSNDDRRCRNKFDGDALLVLFTHQQNSEENLEEICFRAIQCCLEIQKTYTNFRAEEITLSLHIGVSAGQVSSLIVGGVDGKFFSFLKLLLHANMAPSQHLPA